MTLELGREDLGVKEEGISHAVSLPDLVEPFEVPKVPGPSTTFEYFARTLHDTVLTSVSLSLKKFGETSRLRGRNRVQFYDSV